MARKERLRAKITQDRTRDQVPAEITMEWLQAASLLLLTLLCAMLLCLARGKTRRSAADCNGKALRWEQLPWAADKAVACDYIVVGAGCAGCSLTAELVRAGKRVLLLEHGPAEVAARPLIQDTKRWWQAAKAGFPYSAPYRTTPQAALRARRLQAYRGIGGGGSGNVNAGLWSRGRREEYEAQWPWDIADIESSFAAVESALGVERIPAAGPGVFFGKMAAEAGYDCAGAAGWVEDGWEAGAECGVCLGVLCLCLCVASAGAAAGLIRGRQACCRRMKLHRVTHIRVLPAFMAPTAGAAAVVLFRD